MRTKLLLLVRMCASVSLLVTLGVAGSSAFAVTISVDEGTSTSTVIYTAADHTAGAIYSLTGTDASFFTINSGGSVKFASVPDYETKTSYNFTIIASESSGLHSAEDLVININDLPPIFSSESTASINEGVAPGTRVYEAVASDPGGGTVTYSLSGTDADAFTINSSTGVVTMNHEPDFDGKSTYRITVKASDDSGAFNTQTVTISVNPAHHHVNEHNID